MRWPFLVVIAATACVASPVEVVDEPIDDGEDLAEVDDTGEEEVSEGTPDETALQEDIPMLAGAPIIELEPDESMPLARAPQVVYVNFRGPTIKDCSNFCSDATTNRSFVMGHFGKQSMNFAPLTDSG